jgi:hypothetical protein
MSSQSNFFVSLLFLVLRLTPVVTPFLVLDLSGLTAEQYSSGINKLLRLLVVLIVWSMTESVSMLWIREKNAGSPRARGYGAVTLIGAIIVLAFLQVFRSQSSQNQFLLVLTALGARGMTRAGWEQGRAHISVVTAILAHSLVALISFQLVRESLPWQAFVVSTSVGALLAAAETTWYRGPFTQAASKHRWVMALHRVTLIYAPLAIGSLSFMRTLPKGYGVELVLIVPALRLLKRLSSETPAEGNRFIWVAGLYLAFMAIMLACRAYS